MARFQIQWGSTKGFLTNCTRKIWYLEAPDAALSKKPPVMIKDDWYMKWQKHFDKSQIHTQILGKGKIKPINIPILCVNWTDPAHFIPNWQ